MRHRARSVASWHSLLSLMAGEAFAQTNLRIGLGDDPDVLDPTLSRTYTARIVFASICDKLFDIDEKAEHRAAARAQPRDLGRRQDGHHQAAPRREVPRRRAVQRRRRQVQPRPPPQHEGLVPQARDRAVDTRRGGRSADHQAQPQGAVLAAARPAHRPCRHDGVAQGGRGGRRQVRRCTRSAPAPTSSSSASSRTASWSRSSPTTGTRITSSSTGSPTCRSSTARCGWPTCARAGST